jgi:hypothetical protein
MDMEFTGIGAGLAAIGFWGFIAACVVGGIWYDARKRESQQETVRRIVESGRELDPQVLDKLLMLSDGKENRPDLDMKLTALWIAPAAAGLVALGFVIGSFEPQARTPILGAAALAGVLSVGFWIASGIARKLYRGDEDPGLS